MSRGFPRRAHVDLPNGDNLEFPIGDDPDIAFEAIRRMAPYVPLTATWTIRPPWSPNGDIPVPAPKQRPPTPQPGGKPKHGRYRKNAGSARNDSTRGDDDGSRTGSGDTR